MLEIIYKCIWIYLYFNFVLSIQQLTKEEQIKEMQKVGEYFEPLRKNLTQCARQVKASMGDIELFLKRKPSNTLEGKCFVACVLKRYNVIKGNKISKTNIIQMNMEVYGQNSEAAKRLVEVRFMKKKLVNFNFY